MIGPKECQSVSNAEGVIQDYGPDRGPFKVGKAANLYKRFKHYQTHNWFELKVHFSTECEKKNIDKIERRIKARLRDFQIRGEWFDCEKSKIFRQIISVFREYDEIATQKYYTGGDPWPHDYRLDTWIPEYYSVEFGWDTPLVVYGDIWGNPLAYLFSDFVSVGFDEELDEELEKLRFLIKIVDDELNTAMTEMRISEFPGGFDDREIAEKAIESVFREICHHRFFESRL